MNLVFLCQSFISYILCQNGQDSLAEPIWFHSQQGEPLWLRHYPPLLDKEKEQMDKVSEPKKHFGPGCFVLVMVVFPSGYKIMVKKIVSGSFLMKAPFEEVIVRVFQSYLFIETGDQKVVIKNSF